MHAPGPVQFYPRAQQGSRGWCATVLYRGHVLAMHVKVPPENTRETLPCQERAMCHSGRAVLDGSSRRDEGRKGKAP